MKHLILLTFALTLISCSNSKEKLGNNPTVKSVFNDNEIKDLENILMFFENQISETENIPIDSLQKCYESFFIRMEKAEETGFIETRIPFGKQQSLYNLIDTSIFDEIWKISWILKYDSPDTLKHLDINYNGKYASFLESLGKEDKLLWNYYYMFRISGGLSPGMVASLLKLYKNYNTTDIRVRLLIAIHYLTINDQSEREEKW